MITTNANEAGSVTVPDLTGSVVVSDNCSGVTLSQIPPAGTSELIGTYPVTIWAYRPEWQQQSLHNQFYGAQCCSAGLDKLCAGRDSDHLAGQGSVCHWLSDGQRRQRAGDDYL